jgi:hypothetical protein
LCITVVQVPLLVGFATAGQRLSAHSSASKFM